jgi:hypothetical protein
LIYTGFSNGYRPRIISRSFSEKHRAHFTRRPPLPQFFGVVSGLGRDKSEATYHVTGDIPSFKGYYGEPPTSYAGFMMVIPCYSIMAAFYYFIGLPFALHYPITESCRKNSPYLVVI